MNHFYRFLLLIVVLFITTAMVWGQQGQPFAKIMVDEEGNVEFLEMDILDKNLNNNFNSFESQDNRNLSNQKSQRSISKNLIEEGMKPIAKPTAVSDIVANFEYSSYSYSSTTSTLTFNVRVEDQGELFSWAPSTQIGFYLSTNHIISNYDTKLGSAIVHPLVTGAYYDNIVFISIISNYPGTWFVGFILDETNLVDELDEDNSYNFTNVLSNLPDLVPIKSQCSYSYSEPILSFQIKVENHGIANADPCQIGFLLKNTTYPNNEILIGTDEIPSLYRGGSANTSTDIDVSSIPGIWYVAAFADIYNDIEESNELNNSEVFDSPVTITAPYPDLIVQNVEVTDATGPKIEYTFTIKNNGEGQTFDGFRNCIYLSEDQNIDKSDHAIDETECPVLVAAGGTYSAGTMRTTVSGVPAGNYYLGVYTDINNNLTEINENNNTGYDNSPQVVITAPPPSLPDLIVTNVAVSHNHSSAQIVYNFQIANQGNASTGTGFTNYIYLSSDINFTHSDYKIDEYECGVLDAGGLFSPAGTGTLVSGVPAGEYFLGMYADAPGDIVESNEKNNFGYDDEPSIFIADELDEPYEPVGNMISNWNFDNDLDNWLFNASGSASASAKIEDGVLHARIYNGGANVSDVTLNQSDLALITGYRYTATFYARAESPRTIQAWISQSNSPNTVYYNDLFSLTTDWQAYDFEFTMEYLSSVAQFGFNLGTTDIHVFLDNISLVGEKIEIPEEPEEPEEPAGNMIANWSFFHGMDNWPFYAWGTARGSGKVENGTFHAQIESGGENTWDLSIHQYNLTITSGHSYTATFLARAANSRDIKAYIGKNSEPYTLYNNDYTFSLTTDWQKYSFTFTMNYSTDASATFGFEFGTSNADVYLDNISLVEKGIEEPEEPEEPAGNMIDNWSFSHSLNDWQFATMNSGNASGFIEDGVFHAQISNGGGNLWDVRLYQSSLTIMNGRTYSVSFEAKATGSKTIWVSVGMNKEPFITYNPDWEFSLSSDWQTYTFTFTMGYATDTEALITFNLGTSNEDVYLDNISLVDISSTDIHPDVPKQVIRTYDLFQNYPNPFNPSTIILYNIPVISDVEIAIYDMLGKSVKQELFKSLPAGQHKYVFNAEGLSSGLYFYSMRAQSISWFNKQSFQQMKKMVYMK
jgi:hypothetical protein